ncbi:MAG: hypothetical protein J1F35_03240 [Erysipelotrichales bacterium]|nr:hypothetical protein [Erysipelotrichales bacterium]
MKTIIECRRYLDFNNLTSESFANMLKGDLQRAKKDYESENRLDFVNKVSVEIDYDYSPQPLSRVIHFDNLIKESKRAFESIKKSKNFTKAQGWNIEYDIDDRTKKIPYGVKIAMVFDEDYENIIKENRKSEAKRINEFYDSLNYKGD